MENSRRIQIISSGTQSHEKGTACEPPRSIFMPTAFENESNDRLPFAEKMAMGQESTVTTDRPTDGAAVSPSCSTAGGNDEQYSSEQRTTVRDEAAVSVSKVHATAVRDSTRAAVRCPEKTIEPKTDEAAVSPIRCPAAVGNSDECEGSNRKAHTAAVGGSMRSSEDGAAVLPRRSTAVSGNENCASLKGDDPTQSAVADPARFERGRTCSGMLKLHTPTGDVEVEVTFDTASEVDAVSAEMAANMLRMKCSWGQNGGTVTVANGQAVQPMGTMRGLFTAAAKTTGVQSMSARKHNYPLPTDVTFCTDLEIIDNLTANILIGWPTLVGTGLLGVIFGMVEFDPMEDGEQASELEDLWPDETYSCEMPSIGPCTAEQRQQLQDLNGKYKHLFGEPVKGGTTKLPAMDIQLKRNPDGTEMQPKAVQPRYCSPWIQNLIEEDIEMKLKRGWYRRPEPEEVCPYASPVVAAKQPAKGPDVRRICTDLTEPNRCAVETKNPVKNQAQVVSRLQGKRFFCTIDLRKGYHQIRLTDRAAKLLAVTTHACRAVSAYHSSIRIPRSTGVLPEFDFKCCAQRT